MFKPRLLVLAAIALGVQPAQGDFFERPPPGIDVVGVEAVTYATAEDTLADIARRYDQGHEEIRIANPEVEFWLPGDGTRVTVPSRYVLPKAERKGVVVNIPEMRLYYFPEPLRREKNEVLITHPISIGRQDWATPLGQTRITSKVVNPSWTPPKSIHEEAALEGETLPTVVPPGPDNPLGNHAIRLALPGYLLHGTNRPYGVGMRVTHGCIRMYPEDIEALFDRVPIGTPVTFVNQPVKLGWHQEGLFVEVHPGLEEDGLSLAELHGMALELLAELPGVEPSQVREEALAQALDEQSGVPVLIAPRQF